MNRSCRSVFFMWNMAVLTDLGILLKSAMPTYKELLFMSIVASIGGWLSYLLGGCEPALMWLAGFMLVDFLTGNFAVIKQGRWQSSLMYRGIFKKCFIFVMISISHGVDVSLNVDFVRTACIFAYLANEVGSILENIERLGYGDIIPAVLRNALHVLKDKGQINTTMGDKK